jgi:hypothetical protein
MSTADSAGVTGLEVAAGPKVPVDDAANVPAAGGQILPDLTRAVCGYMTGCSLRRAGPIACTLMSSA